MSALNSLLPIAVAIIMLGLGLSLTGADFRRVVEQPRSVVVALVCQVLLLPAVCWGLVIQHQAHSQFGDQSEAARSFSSLHAGPWQPTSPPSAWSS